MAGTLYIVSTPIGNLGDITLRAIEVLKAVDLIAAEDTRTTKKLTAHYGIKTPLTSFYQYNQLKRADYLIGQLKEGKNIALVSEAGTPGISDPGYALIKQAIDRGINVTAVPGPTGFVAALVLSGKPTHKFVFDGFLPAKSGARKRRLRELAGCERTVIIYESPHRILKTLADIYEIFGDREIALCRELTKKFEEVRRQPASALLAHFKEVGPRGEFILVI